MAHLDRDGDVHVLNLGDGENRFSLDSLGELSALLDEVEAAEAPRALVTTASGKFWSNGIDLEWLGANQDRLEDFLAALHGLFSRVLSLGVPNVAAIQGHAFAGGAMLALAHDFRVMRADRGFFCMPEVTIRIPFTPGMSKLIQARLSPAVAHEVMTTGRRYGGEDAARLGIVDHAVGEDEVVARATEIAGALAGNDPATLATIKERMYDGALATLRDPAHNRLG